MTMLRRLAAALVLLLGLGLAGCGEAPDGDAARQVLQQRLTEALGPSAAEIVSFRRLGSGPLPTDGDGRARRIVYYNAVLKLAQDVDFTTWNGLNVVAFATLLGATERGIAGIRQDGNHRDDELRVHGSATFVDDGGAWRAVPWVAPPVGEASPANNTGPPSEAKQLLDSVQALLASGAGARTQRQTIVAEELGPAYERMRLRLDRLNQALVVAGGQPEGAYNQIAALLATRLEASGLAASAVATAGSVDNARMLQQQLTGVALLQNDIAALAAKGEGPFAVDGAMPELRALGSLFPEAIQIVTAADSPITSVADLKGRRIEIAQPGSGARANAEAVLAAAGLAPTDLVAVGEAGLAEGLRMLAAGETDAVFTTMVAPASSLQQAFTADAAKLVALGPEVRAALMAAHPDLVPVTLPANTYPGQTEAVDTLAVTALLVGTAALPDATVEAVLAQIYGGIDFVAAGSTAGSFISKATARQGLTLPLHPAAERILPPPAMSP